MWLMVWRRHGNRIIGQINFGATCFTLYRQLRHLFHSLCAHSTLPNKSLIELHRSVQMRKKRNNQEEVVDVKRRIELGTKKSISSEINSIEEYSISIFHHRIMEMNLLCHHWRHQCHCVTVSSFKHVSSLAPLLRRCWIGKSKEKPVSRTL